MKPSTGRENRRAKTDQIPPVTQERSRSSWKTLFAALGIAVLIAITYWPVMQCQALMFDDVDYLGDNQLVTHPSFRSARLFLTEVLEPSTIGGYYQPLSMISLMIDYALGGRQDNLLVFHATSLTLHVMNALLIGWIIRALLGSGWMGAIAALWFGLHPTSVESVAWVGERKTLLATVFGLASVACYLAHAGRIRTVLPRQSTGGSVNPSRSFYYACIALFGLSLLSKPTTTPIPFVLLLLDIWPLRRFNRRAVFEKVPMLALAVCSAIVTTISQARTAWITPPSDYPHYAVPLILCHNVAFYLAKFVWPTDLAAFYPYPKPFTFSQPALWGGLIATFVVALIAQWSLRRTRAIAICLAAFFIAAFPTMGVIGFTQVIAADRFLYFPMLGLLLLACRGTMELIRRAPQLRFVIGGMVILTLFGEAWCMRAYLPRWQTSEEMFRHLVERAPTTPVVHRGLGIVLNWQGRTDEAVKSFERAVELGNDAGAHNNLAVIKASRGRLDEALAHCRAAVRAAPRWAAAFNNLGNALAAKGMTSDAADAYATAVRLKPRYAGAHGNLGTIHAERGEFAKAIECYRRALEIQSDLANVENNWGDALLRTKQPVDAERHFRAALTINAKLVPAQVGLGDALRMQGRSLDAKAAYSAALALEPNDKDAKAGLAALATSAPVP